MTVRKLLKELEGIDPSRKIAMSRDAEGNGYQLLDSINTDEYTYRDGDIEFCKLTPELEKAGYSDEDVMKGKPFVILWPSHR